MVCYTKKKKKEVFILAEFKTNVMRILEQKKISYIPHSYPHGDDAVDGVTVASLLGQNPEEVFKTLVLKGAKNYFVFVLPVAQELDLKKCAKAVDEKSVTMIPVKEINTITGYIRGGCSPVGMKKDFPTVFHETAKTLKKIMVSAGKIGWQIELSPADLCTLVRGTYADIIKD